MEKYVEIITAGKEDTTVATLPDLKAIVVWGVDSIAADLKEKCLPKAVYTWAGTTCDYVWEMA